MSHGHPSDVWWLTKDEQRRREDVTGNNGAPLTVHDGTHHDDPLLLPSEEELGGHSDHHRLNVTFERWRRHLNHMKWDINAADSVRVGGLIAKSAQAKNAARYRKNRGPRPPGVGITREK
jgi:hypothetical protein